MILGRKRRLPAVPPDPEVVCTEQERRALWAAQQLQTMIDYKVLPRVNQLLGSREFGSAKVVALSINGSMLGVHVYEVSGTLDWVRPLLASLRGPTYRGYTVTAFVEWREAQPRSISRRRSIPLNESDPFSSVMEARRQKRGNRSVCVGVYVKPSR